MREEVKYRERLVEQLRISAASDGARSALESELSAVREEYEAKLAHAGCCSRVRQGEAR